MEGGAKLLTTILYVTYMYCIKERVSNLVLVNKYLRPSGKNSEILISSLTIVTRRDQRLTVPRNSKGTLLLAILCY